MKSLVTLFCLIINISVASSWSRSYSTALVNELQPYIEDPILFWNGVAMKALANDYDRNVTNTPDQAGPTAASRALAIIHGAMYETFTIYNPCYKSIYRPRNVRTSFGTHNKNNLQAGIMEAAYTTLVALFPIQKMMFEEVRQQYLDYLTSIARSSDRLNEAIRIGRLIGNHLLTIRSADRSNISRSYTPVNSPGYHQVDPTRPDQGYLSPNWGRTEPFIIRCSSQFRASDMVGEDTASRNVFLNSTRYRSDFNEVKRLGARTSSHRTSEQTEIANFWAYDGALRIGVPPRLYNQVLRAVAIEEKNSIAENALLFAMVNYAMADAGIAAWETKYYFNLWRPIVGVRQTAIGLGGDPNWTPLGAPSNGNGDNFTPGFPSYVSGHSTFGSALFQVLRLFYGTDMINFNFQSDEYNGQTFDSTTRSIRPARTRYYQSFTQAENENFLSRIYLGVHWRFDQEEGRTMGRKIGTFVYDQMAFSEES